MIQLGLQRAAQLFRRQPQPWRAVHVAGTNGKGTVCAYLSALLHGSGIRCGRFTSPHLIDRWDCITVNEQPISEVFFRKIENQVLERNKVEKIQATEFEILTATAFDIFTAQNVEVAVIEVGMGGRDDATNVLKHKDLAVVTRIGLDHQAFLGDGIEEIARHKCGIFGMCVPVIYNATNDQAVVKVIEEAAAEHGVVQKPEDVLSLMKDNEAYLCPIGARTELPQLPGEKWKKFMNMMEGREQQRIAINQAWHAFTHMHSLLRSDNKPSEKDKLHSANTIMNLQWPGRLQRLDISPLIPKAETILLDGAHNIQAAENLAKVVNSEFRTDKIGKRISWVIACTQGRSITDIMTPLLQSGDRIATVEFGPVAGMPWVSAQPSRDTATTLAAEWKDNEIKSFAKDLKAALEWAVEGGDPVVVTGSLYLCSDLLRMLRDAGMDVYSTPAIQDIKEKS